MNDEMQDAKIQDAKYAMQNSMQTRRERAEASGRLVRIILNLEFRIDFTPLRSNAA
jgi:hypothetical protein